MLAAADATLHARKTEPGLLWFGAAIAPFTPVAGFPPCFQPLSRFTAPAIFDP